MNSGFAKALDEYIEHLRNEHLYKINQQMGADLNECLEQLVRIGTVISSALRIVPTNEFKKNSKEHIITHIRLENAKKIKTISLGARLQESLNEVQNKFSDIFARPARVAIPVALSLLIAIGGGIFISSLATISSPSTVLASGCTLSIMNGDVQVKPSGASTWKEGSDGITLEAGSIVKTAADSKALITFFEGSTIELDANTQIEIECLENSEEGYTSIILQQILGRTWSRVVELTDSHSRYEVNTPSSCAMVRGTMFLTQVDNTGSTLVQVAKGLVIVNAQGGEEPVPAGYECSVVYGNSPDQHVQIHEYVSTPPLGTSMNTDNVNGNGDDKGNGNGHTTGNSNSNSNSNSDGNGNSNGNGNGNGNGNANGNGNGNANGNSNSDANGNSNSNSNSNSDGNGNSNGNGNGKGNGNANNAEDDD